MVALDAALDVYAGLHGLVDPDHASLVMVESDEPAVAIAHAATSGGYKVVLTSDPEVALYAREVGAAVLMAAGGALPAPESAPTEMAGGRAHLVFAGEMGGRGEGRGRTPLHAAGKICSPEVARDRGPLVARGWHGGDTGAGPQGTGRTGEAARDGRCRRNPWARGSLRGA